MELRHALEKANQIVDEERVSPTVGYLPTEQGTGVIVHVLGQASRSINLTRLRLRPTRRAKIIFDIRPERTSAHLFAAQAVEAS
jgi:hypothetical protein